jgi:hypothetical protein
MTYPALVSRSRRQEIMNARIAVLMSIMITIVMFALAGCGKQATGRGPLFPAEGQILLDNKPLAEAIVTLYPQGLPPGITEPSRGITGLDGKFHLSTFSADDGVPAGEYAVTVIHYPMQKQLEGGYTAGPNDVPKKFASAKTTDLKILIAEGKTTIPALAIHTPKPKKGFQPRNVIYSE